MTSILQMFRVKYVFQFDVLLLLNVKWNKKQFFTFNFFFDREPFLFCVISSHSRFCNVPSEKKVHSRFLKCAYNLKRTFIEIKCRRKKPVRTARPIQWMRVAKTTYSTLLNNLFIAVYFIMTVVCQCLSAMSENTCKRERNDTSTWISCFMYRFIAQSFLSVTLRSADSNMTHSNWLYCRSCVSYVLGWPLFLLLDFLFKR